ncbi:MAG: SDR family oxidoreductase [Acidobacteria bacterium]|nr:SDR family oxidoreductase [Acidobacteriota bacterium]
MATYLVTGVAGFIGSSIAHELLRQGHNVRGVDNFITGKKENIAEFAGRLDFLEMDICDLAGMQRVCRGVDYVFHEAALASVPRSVKDPISSNDSNVTGTLNILVAARDAGVKRVVYAASSSAYGDTPTLPKREDMLPNPISPYAVSKLAGEHYMASFYRVYGLETVSLRYFNVFGPRQAADSPYSGVLAKFITLMLEGRQATIFGDGEQSRDFTYIDNVVQANLRACGAPAAAVAGRMFNIALGTRFTLNQTFAALKKIIGYNGNAAYGPEREGDVKHSQADITEARRQFGFDPKVSFEEGLDKTVAWYRTQMTQAEPATVR